MTHDQKWDARYREYAKFIADNGRCPSKHFIKEHTLHSWWKYQRKLINAGKMQPDRKEKFMQLLALAEANRHVNQFH